jgi:predicted regulator of amino acid metabolism with ACT domain
MTINIQKCSNVTVIGHHDNGNCKAVYNITTGDVYASITDAAEILGVTKGSVSQCVLGITNTCKGMRLCYLSKMAEHLEEITEQNRVRYAESKAYKEQTHHFSIIRKVKELIAKHKGKIANTKALINKYQAKIDALNEVIANETALLNEAKAKLDELYEEV